MVRRRGGGGGEGMDKPEEKTICTKAHRQDGPWHILGIK